MDLLGIFAKYWEPGQVKTRLANKIGAARASDLYLAFLKKLFARFSDLGERRQICFWPPPSESHFAQLGGGKWELVCQSSGNLGTRMRQFFQAALEQGARRVVLIGSDCPTLPKPFIHSAFDALSDVDCVIGPSRDGGYYLIGLNQARGELFEDIPWSTDQVLHLTLRRLTQLGLAHELLDACNDIDDVEDLIQLRDQLKNRPSDEDSQLLAKIELALSEASA